MSGAHMIKHSGPPPHVHVPESQPSAVSPQLLPQRPQLFSSLAVLMQLPEQQSCDPEHVRPHAPQFMFVSVLVHTPLQQV